MPIQVEIKINEKTLRTIHIARINKPIVDGENEYLVVRTPGATSIPKESFWEDEGVKFTHTRGDVEELVTNALDALQKHDSEIAKFLEGLGVQ